MKSTFRSNRTRSKLHGTATRPRLSVNVSNRHVLAQLIDDDKGVTLAYATSVGTKMTGNKTEICEKIGTEIAKKAKKAGIKQAVFDRGGRLYAGRLSALANAARKEGLEF